MTHEEKLHRIIHMWSFLITAIFLLSACSPSPTKPIPEPEELVVLEEDLPFMALVGITATKPIKPTFRERDPAFNNPFIEPSFKREGTPVDMRNAGRGIGFLIDQSGLIATAAHIVADDEALYEVALVNGAVLPGKVIMLDLKSDTALLRIESGFALPVLTLSDQDAYLGQSVKMLNGKSGRIIARDQELTATTRNFAQHLTGLLQTDISISPGDSGNPLLNMEGEVIGVISVFNAEEEMRSFAVPIEKVKSLVAEAK